MKNKKSRKKKLLISLPIIVAFVVLWIAFCGYQWSWGPFEKLHDIKTSSLAGNDIVYSLDKAETVQNSALENKRLIFLGSSVTYGAASKGVSFADYIGKRNNCTVIKEAVSGTTLVDNGVNSYIKRLEKINEAQADIFICQLSTNDATQDKPLGEISSSKNIDDFDTSTVAGAIEYIIAYAQDKWNCPVVFYTNPKYDSENYEKMVDLLYEIKDKWSITIIDLYSDEEFNNITDEERKLYLADKIHPTQAGYLEWWTPVFENTLEEVIKIESN
ncbi:MAG: SGNH/GDSL hydrolase family protein [Eubacterium coprostanoligenes]|uniref:SGNH/GDSL hydrolase family protein n=1 Tax=Eubacterium coprostanoligenes TaxID=290054 RepID=UPI00240A00BB|nr:SGNH/GDSL hydrolase family protein [Eubacterium coprostanoligenes]MDD6664776.1 SGNH/GDSL hydrolase family protein [Eubacterium coprostanoligenes]